MSSRPSLGVSYLLWAFLGYLGAHRFYLRDYGWGIVYFLTGGLFMIGWFVDAFLLPGKVDQMNREIDALEAGRLAPARLVGWGSGYRPTRRSLETRRRADRR